MIWECNKNELLIVEEGREEPVVVGYVRAEVEGEDWGGSGDSGGHLQWDLVEVTGDSHWVRRVRKQRECFLYSSKTSDRHCWKRRKRRSDSWEINDCSEGGVTSMEAFEKVKMALVAVAQSSSQLEDMVQQSTYSLSWQNNRRGRPLKRNARQCV